MDYMSYLQAFTPEGIRRHIEKDHSENMMAVQYMERVYFVLDVAAADEVLPKCPLLKSTIVNQILLYSLYKLDRAKFYLKDGIRNINLDSMTLLDIMTNDDYRMRSFETLDIQREYTTVMLCVSVLYMLAMCKYVEIQTMLGTSADLSKPALTKSFVTAQEMLADARHFSHNAYDTQIMKFLNHTRQGVGSVSRRKRAF